MGIRKLQRRSALDMHGSRGAEARARSIVPGDMRITRRTVLARHARPPGGSGRHRCSAGRQLLVTEFLPRECGKCVGRAHVTIAS